MVSLGFLYYHIMYLATLFHVKAMYLGIAFHRGQNAVSCNFSDCSVAGSRQLKSHLEREHGMLPPSSRKMRGTILSGLEGP